MQDGRHSCQQRALVRHCETEDQKLDGNETAALWSALGSVVYLAPGRPSILHASQDRGKVIPRVWSDCSACRGIVRRTGTSRLRHLEIRHMWTQERLQKSEFLVKSVSTDGSVAELMTKHLSAARVEDRGSGSVKWSFLFGVP